MTQDAATNPNSFDPPTQDQAFGGGTHPTGAGSTDLGVFDDEYDQTEAPSLEEVPDGRYQVRVQRVELGASRAGDPMLKWDLVVISGQHAGRHVFKNAVITHKSLPFVKGDLQMLGVRLPRFSDLPHHLDELLDRKLEITKRTRGDYTNVYFNRLLDLAGHEGGVDLSKEPAPF